MAEGNAKKKRHGPGAAAFALAACLGILPQGPALAADTLETEGSYTMTVTTPPPVCVPQVSYFESDPALPYEITENDAQTCSYRITVIGGKGGDRTKAGGLGGVVAFDFSPAEAGVLTLLVGASGAASTSQGGGASAVKFNSTVLAVAGGGGGGPYGYRSTGTATTYAGYAGGPSTLSNMCSTGGCPVTSGAVINADFGISAGGVGGSASGGTGGCIIAQGIGGNGGAGLPGGNGGTAIVAPNVCSTRTASAYGGQGGKGFIATVPEMSNMAVTTTYPKTWGRVIIERVAKP